MVKKPLRGFLKITLVYIINKFMFVSKLQIFIS